MLRTSQNFRRSRPRLKKKCSTIPWTKLTELRQNDAPEIPRRTIRRRLLADVNIKKWIAANRRPVEKEHAAKRLEWVAATKIDPRRIGLKSIGVMNAPLKEVRRRRFFGSSEPRPKMEK